MKRTLSVMFLLRDVTVCCVYACCCVVLCCSKVLR